MPRPNPLHNITSAHSTTYDHVPLTPRTPHSRAGRAEAAYGDIELEDIQGNRHDDDHRSEHQQQSEPLIRNGRRVEYLYNKDFEKRKLDLHTVLGRMPVVIMTMLALMLCSLILVSYKKPGTIEYYMGVIPPSQNTTNSSSISRPELIISYENYTTFPLQPDEYRKECSKMKMFHGGYWKEPPMGVMDVLHKDNDPRVCSSTITYMLDGKIGLLADLALMAQAAAFAREVHPIPYYTAEILLLCRGTEPSLSTTPIGIGESTSS
jgi:hypothetical protein